MSDALPQTRRKLLGSGLLGFISLAGCLGDDDGAQDSDDNADGDQNEEEGDDEEEDPHEDLFEDNPEDDNGEGNETEDSQEDTDEEEDSDEEDEVPEDEPITADDIDGGVDQGEPYVQTGLQSYYPLDEAEPRDRSGNKHHAQIQGDVSTGETGVKGTSYLFTGDSDNPELLWLHRGDRHPIAGEVTWSVSLWCKLEEGVLGDDVNQALLGNWTLSVDAGGISLHVDDEGSLHLMIDNQPEEEFNELLIRGVGTLEEEVWYHVAASVRRDEARLYLDGELLATSKDEPGAGQEFKNSGAGDQARESEYLGLGTVYDSIGGWWGGWLDEVYVCNQAFDDDAVKALYEADRPD